MCAFGETSFTSIRKLDPVRASVKICTPEWCVPKIVTLKSYLKRERIHPICLWRNTLDIRMSDRRLQVAFASIMQHSRVSFDSSLVGAVDDLRESVGSLACSRCSQVLRI